MVDRWLPSFLLAGTRVIARVALVMVARHGCPTEVGTRCDSPRVCISAKEQGVVVLLQLALSVFPPRCKFLAIFYANDFAQRDISLIFIPLFLSLICISAPDLARNGRVIARSGNVTLLWTARTSSGWHRAQSAPDDLRTRSRSFLSVFLLFFFYIFYTRDIFYRYILMRRLYSSPRSSDIYPMRESRSQTHGLVQGS